MGTFNKIFYPFVDELYNLQAQKKTNSLFLEHELFEGKEYTIDAFYEISRKYFNNPGEFYCDSLFQHAPNLQKGFHSCAVDKTDANRFGYIPMVFTSQVQTKWNETNTAPFRWFRNQEKKSNVLLLFSPGWARPNLNFEKAFCSQLMRNGIDLGLMSVPYHQERAPKSSYSGEYYISGNVFWTISNFRHYVAEILFLIRYMRHHYDYVGLIGMSSGGFTAGLAVDIEPVDFYFPLITGAGLGRIVWESSLAKYIKRDLIRRGLGLTDINKAWAIGDQVFLAHNSRASYIKQYISLYDKVIPTEYQYLLWEKYNRPDKLELTCAHISVAFFINKLVEDITTTIKNRIVECRN